MVNVLCMKWGTKYGPEYVNRLFHMVQRNLSLPFRFTCLTDDTTGLEAGIETLPIPEIEIPARHAHSPWRKLTLFSERLGDLRGKALFLDLDLIILQPIDDFFSYSEKFSIIENWSQRGRGIGNSSVYCFEIGGHPEVLAYYQQHSAGVLQRHSNEQIYLSRKIGDIDFWPPTWCRSFKYHAIPRGPMRYFKSPRIPEGCRILVFHGHPNPDAAMIGDYRGRWRKYFKPAPWIGSYWY